MESVGTSGVMNTLTSFGITRDGRAREDAFHCRPGDIPNLANRRRRPPKSATVDIRSVSDRQSYTDMLRKATDGVSLRNLGISGTRLRRMADDSLLVEIPEPKCSIKTDQLADHL